MTDKFNETRIEITKNCVNPDRWQVAGRNLTQLVLRAEYGSEMSQEELDWVYQLRNILTDCLVENNFILEVENEQL